MRTQSFTENGVTITVRAETIEDALDTEIIAHQLGITNARENYKLARFLQLWLVSTVEGDLGFEWPANDASPEQLTTAFHAWKKLPANLARVWVATYALANVGSNDPELTPNVSEKKEATPA